MPESNLKNFDAHGINFEHIIDNMPANIYFKDLDGKYIWCSESQIALLKLKSKHDIIGKTDFQLIEYKQAELVWQNDCNVMQNEITITIEETVNLEGYQFRFLSKKSPLYNDQRIVVGIVGVSLEISKKKI